MPRRKIVPAAGETAGLIDMKTGKSARNVLPPVCGKIRFFRERRGLEQKELAARLGVTANAVSNWENGRGRPDINLLPDICRALGISLYRLFGLDEPSQSYSEAERRLIERFRTLTPDHRTAVEQLTDTLSRARFTEPRPLRRLILFARSLSAGPGDPTEFEEAGTPLWVYSSRETERADYVFTINGDSMEPRYHNGERVLVSRLSDRSGLPVGEAGAFIVGNETYIKLRGEDGLYSLNPAYPPMRFDETASVYLIGRVTGVLDPAQIARETDGSISER